MNTPYFLTSVPPSPKWQWSPGSTQSPCLCGVFALILSALPANLPKTASQSLAWWQQDCQQDVMSAFVMGWSKYKLWLVLLYIIEIVDKNDMTFSKIYVDFLCRYIEFLDMSCDELSFPVHAVVVYVAICAALTTSRHRDTSPITSHISCTCTICKRINHHERLILSQNWRNTCLEVSVYIQATMTHFTKKNSSSISMESLKEKIDLNKWSTNGATVEV